MSWALPLATFIHSALGHGNLGTNDVNKGQCTGLVALWLEQMHKPLIYADGKDMLTAADPKAYHVELNGPSNYPTPGAVVIVTVPDTSSHLPLRPLMLFLVFTITCKGLSLEDAIE